MLETQTIFTNWLTENQNQICFLYTLVDRLLSERKKK